VEAVEGPQVEDFQDLWVEEACSLPDLDTRVAVLSDQALDQLQQELELQRQLHQDKWEPVLLNNNKDLVWVCLA